jgi:excisionase family DNA binding protein
VTPPNPKLTGNEVVRIFDGELAAKFPPILSPTQLAELFGLSVKTIYLWIAAGRLDGSFRRRGKHVLIWRDRAIDLLFNGRDWQETK